MDISEVQKRAWYNKVNKGFNTTDLRKEIEYIREEVNEAEESLYDRHLIFELADLVIFAAGMAEMSGGDLDAAVEEKLAVIEARVYVLDEYGNHVKAVDDSY